MRSFRDTAVLFIGLSLLAPAPLGAQVDLLAEGDFLASQGLSDEAVTSYLRYIFLHPGSAGESSACHKIARVYAGLNDAANAFRWADLAIEKARGESERRDRVFARAELYLAFNRPDSALREMEPLDALNLAVGERGRLWFLQGVAATYLGNWERAAARFRDYFALTAAYPPLVRERVLALLEFASRSVPLSPAAAEVMSFILPGSGQVYAGDLFQGLNSLAVTGGSAALVVWAIASGDYFDAAAAVYFVFARFYTGGPWNAARIASERNANRTRAIQRAVLDLLAR
jgi:tetratricopeptide (TPR) repeat protein